MTREKNLEFIKNKLRKYFIEGIGYEPNFDEPKTFNEKLNWLKLYYHDSRITKYADKYYVREYIKETIGEEYLIPLIGVWDSVEDIDFDSLPNQFVLKVNWGSGQNIIVKDKAKINIEEIKNKLEYWMKPTSNHYYTYYEWGYKYIEPKILCEKFIKDNNTENLTVYGVYCSSGKPSFIHVITDAHTGLDKCTIYDTNWNKLDVHYIWDPIPYSIQKPTSLNTILQLASKLASDFPHVRIDFFSINEKIYSSEITFYTNAGLTPFTPVKWDYKFGENIILPKEKKIDYDFLDRDILIHHTANLEPIVKQYRDLEEDYNKLKPLEEKINLYSKKFSLFTIFNIDILSFTSNKEYFILTILGIKIVFKHKVRPDQTRPDQTRPDQTRPDQT
ncbi:ATP-grasp fold amidoligase family protein [Brachyspira hyodysenteriae]|nr:ATP-grasp fold amidoligase family protein [Brachyspira hyodysenteriae]MCZ9920813.1 glycosyl transferase [Brachyspira hyodysenteriae]MDA0158601.1 glycosyl transferase [Brachyspira hyodysenteriae]